MKTAIKAIGSFVLFTVAFSSCKKEAFKNDSSITALQSKTKGVSSNPRSGFVYTTSNEAFGNRVIHFLQKPNGTLAYQSSTASGGNGTDAGLGSQGSVVVDASHQWLFAVNAGSNSVSSFAIHDDGSLSLAGTASSHGVLPVSVTVHGSVLYVVNSTTSNISGYNVHNDGSLHYIDGSEKLLSAPAAGPAQISFTPGGDRLIVTEKATNRITTFAVNASGVAATGNSQPSAGVTPFGFDFAGSNTIVVTEASGGMPNASTVSAYHVGGVTTLSGGPVHGNQTSACWATVTNDGKYAYTANTGSNTISLFEVTGSGNLKLIKGAEATTGTTPIDITLSGNDFYLYNVNSASHSITQFKKGGNASLKRIGEYTGLPLHAAGIAAF